MDYFDAAKEALELLRKSPFGKDPPARFEHLTQWEVNEEIGHLTSELEQQVVMMLAASFEAVFQSDARNRIERRQKDPISKRLRSFVSSRPRRKRRSVELERILDFWKTEVQASRSAIGNLAQLIEYRHWLARGRYWTQKSGLISIYPVEAYNRGRAALDACGIV